MSKRLVEAVRFPKLNLVDEDTDEVLVSDADAVVIRYSDGSRDIVPYDRSNRQHRLWAIQSGTKA